MIRQFWPLTDIEAILLYLEKVFQLLGFMILDVRMSDKSLANIIAKGA